MFGSLLVLAVAFLSSQSSCPSVFLVCGLGTEVGVVISPDLHCCLTVIQLSSLDTAFCFVFFFLYCDNLVFFLVCEIDWLQYWGLTVYSCFFWLFLSVLLCEMSSFFTKSSLRLKFYLQVGLDWIQTCPLERDIAVFFCFSIYLCLCVHACVCVHVYVIVCEVSDALELKF